MATVARKLHSSAAHSNWTCFLYCPGLTTEKSLKASMLVCLLSQLANTAMQGYTETKLSPSNHRQWSVFH